MKMTWKKPLEIAAWLLRPEKFEPEEGPVPGYPSRFGPDGFRGWLFSGERFEEEPEITLHEPRFGGKTFFQWLFSPEGDPSERGNARAPAEKPGQGNPRNL